jgi:hypothetical protein
MAPSTWLWLVLVPLMAFALYRRLRRTFGRQELRTRRVVFRMAMLSILAGIFVALSPTAQGLGAAGLGAALGIALAILGLAHTRYEVTEKGTFYTGNGWIGITVTALFLGRMVARLGTLSVASAASPDLPSPFSSAQRSPLTVCVFLLMASYYVTYYAGCSAGRAGWLSTQGALPSSGDPSWWAAFLCVGRGRVSDLRRRTGAT